MSIENQTAATARFFSLVRQYALRTPPWAVAKSYQTKPDERFNLPLASRRAYGRPDEFVAMMAAAGLDSVEQEMPEQLLILPDESTLKQFKLRAGFVNLPDDRNLVPANYIPPEYIGLLGPPTDRGVPPTIVLVPSFIDFPETIVGGQSEPVVVRLSNSGDSDLVINDLFASAGFGLVDDQMTPIKAGQYRDLAVVFNPSDEGEFSGNLQIWSNASKGAVLMPLRGSAASFLSVSRAAITSFDPSTASVKQARVETPPVITTLTRADDAIIEATDIVFGNGPVQLGAKGVRGDLPDGHKSISAYDFGEIKIGSVERLAVRFFNLSDQWVFVTLPEAGTGAFRFVGEKLFQVITIEPLSYYSGFVEFHATSTSSFSESMQYTYGQNGTVGALSLMGLGTVDGKVLECYPPSGAYGTTRIGTHGARTFRVSNTGDAPIDVAMSTSGNFTIVGAGVRTLVAGESALVEVRFTPTEAGDAVGSFTASYGRHVASAVLSAKGVEVALDKQWLSANGGNLVDGEGNHILLQSVSHPGAASVYCIFGLWGRGYKTLTVDGVVEEGILDQIKRLGFNSIRLPICQTLLTATRITTTIDPSLNPDLFTDLKNPWTNPQPTLLPMELFDKVIDYATNTLGLRIILDMHQSTTLYVPEKEGKWYTTDFPGDVGATAGAPGEPRNEKQWIDAWVAYADRYKSNPLVCAFDLFNEPWQCSWDNDPVRGWPAAVERCARKIHEVNPNVMIVVEGVTGDVDFGNGQVWGVIWSANLTGVATRPIVLDVPNKVMYSPHEYMCHSHYLPAGSYSHPWVSDPGFPWIMPHLWRLSWGFIVEQGIAPVWVGEYGSSYEVNDLQNPPYMQMHADADALWVEQWGDYLKQTGVNHAWWFTEPSRNSSAHLLGLLDEVVGAPVSNTYGEARLKPYSIVQMLLAAPSDI